MLVVAGYLASILIGVTLGLIGGGGSILTVPVLVYLFGIDPVVATACSLFIVGITSVVGSFSYFNRGLVNVRIAVLFGLPSIVAVYLTRAYVIPNIPLEIMRVGSFVLSRSMLLMLIFAVLMLVSSFSMIKKSSNKEAKENSKNGLPYYLILVEGLVVGTLTGLVGAGGGFLIIPALVILGRLPMKEAVGTSLVIISAKSLIGFLGESNLSQLDWRLLSFVTVFAVIGIFIGMLLSHRIDGGKLKPAFGWFVLVMGVYIILKETILR